MTLLEILELPSVTVCKRRKLCGLPNNTYGHRLLHCRIFGVNNLFRNIGRPLFWTPSRVHNCPHITDLPSPPSTADVLGTWSLSSPSQMSVNVPLMLKIWSASTTY